MNITAHLIAAITNDIFTQCDLSASIAPSPCTLSLADAPLTVSTKGQLPYARALEVLFSNEADALCDPQDELSGWGAGGC